MLNLFLGMVMGVFIFYLFVINSSRLLKFVIRQSLSNPVKGEFELYEKQNADKRNALRNFLKKEES